MGKTGFMVCAGALCRCNFGTAPAMLKVLTQRKHYINDPQGAQKLIATNMELGMPFQMPLFGTCAKKMNTPCTVILTGWSGFYEKVTFENGAHPLLDSSKGTCPIGSTDCISIMWHGQVASPTMINAQQVQTMTAQINPMVNAKHLNIAGDQTTKK